MPCTNCMVKYTKFCKEHGCSKCAFSFCEKCVQQKFIIPNLSPNPVSVCNNCFNLLSRKVKDTSFYKSRESFSNLPSTADKPQNWWGDDKLPPPSMRAQYANEKKKARSKDTNDCAGLERRLEALIKNNYEGDDEGDDENGVNCQKDDKVRLNPSKKKPKDKKDVSLFELEKRLAALRGVPVDYIRNSQLMVVNANALNDNENECNEGLTDEAQKLLKAAETKSKFNDLHEGYDNPALQLDDLATSLDSIRNMPSTSSINYLTNLSTRTSNSSLIQKIVKETEEIPYLKDNDTDFSTTKCIYSNFSDCIRETKRNAEAAEKNAVAFIQKSQQQINNNGPATPTAQHQPRQGQSSLNTNETTASKESPRKKAMSFFHRIFK